MKITANSIRQGNIIEHKNKLWVVMKQPEHTMPGKGGAFVQVSMRDIKTSIKLNERFRSSEYVEKVRLDNRDYQFLYIENDKIALMDIADFSQIYVDVDVAGDKVSFLQDGMIIQVESYDESPVNIIFPETVVLSVIEADPVVKGQTAAASYKPVLLENNMRIMVPPFIVSNDKIVVKTEDSSYVERYKSS